MCCSAKLASSAASLSGLKCAVLAIVLSAVQRVRTRALKNSLMRAVAVAAFVGYLLSQHPVPGDHPRRGRDRLCRRPHGGAAIRGRRPPRFGKRYSGMRQAFWRRDPGARPPVDWPIAAGRHHLALRLAASRRWPDVIRGIERLHLDRLFQQDVACHLWRGLCGAAYVAQQSVEHYHWLRCDADRPRHG